MTLALWTAAVVALLGVLVLAHELGHFLVAKLFGVKVLRFSLGFGPKLFSFTAGATEYRLSLFPLGGYVRLVGEEAGEPVADKDRERAMCSKPLWQRFAIVMAGPLFNLILPSASTLCTTWVSAHCCRPPWHGHCRTAGLQCRVDAWRSRGDCGRALPPLLGGVGRGDQRRAGQDPALRHPPRHRGRGARRDAGTMGAAGSAQYEGDRGLDRGVAAFPASRGGHHRSDLAGGPGRATKPSITSRRSMARRWRTGASSSARWHARVPRPCASPTYAERIRRCPSCMSRSRNREPR